MQLTAGAARALADAWAPHRPPHRRGVPLAQTATTALRMANATLLAPPCAGTVAVELKPKWGYLPAAPWAAPVKRATCRFCMHRALKRATTADAREQAATIAHDAFCPLDLFAPDPHRVASGTVFRHRTNAVPWASSLLPRMGLAALEALLEGPGNNLRLFEDGRRVFPDVDAEAAGTALGPSAHAAVDAVLARLLPDAHDRRRTAFGAVLAAILTAEPLLAALKRAQRDLDALDVEGILPVYSALAARVPGGTLAVERALQDLTDLAPWTAAVSAPVDLPASLDEVAAADPPRLWAWLRRFLVATTLKDCSVFVALRRELPHDSNVHDRLQDDSGPGRITVVLPTEGRTVAFVYRLQGTCRPSSRPRHTLIPALSISPLFPPYPHRALFLAQWSTSTQRIRRVSRTGTASTLGS